MKESLKVMLDELACHQNAFFPHQPLFSWSGASSSKQGLGFILLRGGYGNELMSESIFIVLYLHSLVMSAFEL